MAASGPDAQAGGEDSPKMPDLSALQSLQNAHSNLPDLLMKRENILFMLKYWQQRTQQAETAVQSLQEQLENYRVQNKENNNNNSKLDNAINNNNESNNMNSSENGNMCIDSESSDRQSPNDFKSSQPITKDKDVKMEEDRIRSQRTTPTNLNDSKEKIEVRDREFKIKSESRMETDEIRRDHISNAREFRGVLDTGALGIHPRALDGLLLDRVKFDQEMKPEFGNTLPQLGHSPFSQPLRPHIHPQLGSHLPPPPLLSPFQPLAPQPPPGTPFHHLLNEEWRRSLNRSAVERSILSSGQTSPDQRINNHSDRTDSRESPIGDSSMKSPQQSVTNGYIPENKSPFQHRENRSPFREDTHLAYKFEDRITGESLIPKGDPMEARLQEILRYNMEKYCHTNLDTLLISRKVRELLSVHNIGQRLFAKYILGLSQGTVSELLSKPKSWDKLTEKGRDSYRKMNAWACDDGAVYLLKSLIPKKGTHKECVRGGSEEIATDDRIQHILTEATRVIVTNDQCIVPPIIPNSTQPQLPISQPNVSHQGPITSSSSTLDQDSRSTDSKSPASSTHSPSPISREGRRLRKDIDDLSHEKVAKLYQEELMRLMSRQAHPEMLQRENQYPNLLFPFLGQSFFFNRSPEEMKLVLDAYHQELSKMHVPSTGLGLGAAGLGIGGSANSGHLGLGVGGTPPMSMGLSLGAGGHNGAEDLSLPKRDHRNSEEEDEISSRIPSVGSPFCLGRLKPETSLAATSASPHSSLVGPINSITSISSSTSNGSLDDATSTTASPLQRMASITNSLMTAPPLTGASPLSQKPMKAVLPPITQQQFDQYSNMNTEEIVKKVKEQLSQYSISQRLFGESVLGLSQGSVSDLLARPKPWHMLTQKGREPFIRMKIFLEDDNAVHKLVASQYKIAPEKLMRTGGYGGSLPCASMKTHHIKLPPDLPKTSLESPLPAVGIPSSLALTMPHHGYEPRLPYLDPLRKVFPFQSSIPMRNPGMGASSVYELAALTTDLDTQAITTKIKEALLANNIGQKLFGETILGLSQGSVSELLSKPKPWHMLSIKGREPFIRMHMWMNDPSNIEKLQQIKTQRREATKRRRALDPSLDMSQDSQDFFQVPSPGGTSKKARVLFSEDQKEAMRVAFMLDPYPTNTTVEFLSQELHLSCRTIANWFHNHRMRLKQQSSSPDGNAHSPPRDLPQSQNQFDPMQFRIILSQRLLELRKEKGLPSSIPGLGPGLPPGFHPGLFPHLHSFSAVNFGLSHSDYNSIGGLDLSMKGEHDLEDSNASFGDDDSNMSPSYTMGGNCSEGDEPSDDRERRGSASPVNRPSSRRKPAAPQWVDPSWVSGTNDKEQEVINGVCVMQTDDYRQNREDETVLIEPTPVTEEVRKSQENRDITSSPTMETENSSIKNETEEPPEPNSPENFLVDRKSPYPTSNPEIDVPNDELSAE